MKLEWFANEWNDHYLTQDMDLVNPYIWVGTLHRVYHVMLYSKLTQQESIIIFDYPKTYSLYKMQYELSEVARLYLPEATIDTEVHHVV